MAGEIVLVGTGPGPVTLLTRGAEAELLRSERVFFRMSAHPVYHWLLAQGRNVFSFDALYATPNADYDTVYELIAAAIIKEAQSRGRAVYALPGHPLVGENTSQLILEKATSAESHVTVIPGLSFLDVVFAELKIDPVGVQICNALDFTDGDFAIASRRALLVTAVLARSSPLPGADRPNAGFMARALQRAYPSTHPVVVIWTEGVPDYDTRSQRVSLADVEQFCQSLIGVPFASVYVPALPR